MANFPTSAFSASAKSAGQVIQSAHVNEITDEVTAIEQALLGTGSPNLSIGGNLTLGGSLVLPVLASYVPTWGNSGTANTLGNGSIAGSYTQIGKLVFFTVSLTWGGTTSSGNGFWTFTIPSTAGAAPIFAVVAMIDSSTGTQYVGGAFVNAATAVAPLTFPSTAVTATSPFTWASADTLTINGLYWVS